MTVPLDQKGSGLGFQIYSPNVAVFDYRFFSEPDIPPGSAIA